MIVTIIMVSFLPQLHVPGGSRSMGIQVSVANAFGAPKGCSANTLVLQLLISVQDCRGQACYFPRIPAFTRGMLFHKMSREKKQSWQMK